MQNLIKRDIRKIENLPSSKKDSLSNYSEKKEHLLKDMLKM